MTFVKDLLRRFFRRKDAPAPVSPVCFFFIEKINDPELENTLQPVAETSFTIGRDPRCALVVRDLGDQDHQCLARHHARVTRSGEDWLLSSLCNGFTAVDGTLVRPDADPAVLHPGCQIILGRTELRFFITKEQADSYRSAAR